jgi:hypothetical protein
MVVRTVRSIPRLGRRFNDRSLTVEVFTCRADAIIEEDQCRELFFFVRITKLLTQNDLGIWKLNRLYIR